MPQLSLYLNESEMDALREHAALEGVSLSCYARKALNAEASAWPDGYWGLYGALTDPSFTLPADLDESWDRPSPSFDEEPACIS